MTWTLAIYKRLFFNLFASFFIFFSLSSLRFSLDFRFSFLQTHTYARLGDADPNLAFDLKDLGLETLRDQAG